MTDLTSLGVKTAPTPQTCRADLRRRPSQQLFNTIGTTPMTPGCNAMRKVPLKTSLPLPPTSSGDGLALLPYRKCTSLLDLNSLRAQEELNKKQYLPSSIGLDPIFQEKHEEDDVLCF